MNVNLDVDNLANVGNDQIANYNQWKKARYLLIESLGHELLLLDEAQIVNKFDRWYAEIQKNAKIELPRVQLNLLLSYSIFYYFEKDMDRLKNSFEIIENLLMAKDLLVSRCANKVLHWLSSDIPDAINLFKQAVENAFKCIQEQRDTKFANALLIIKYANKFMRADILHYCTQNLNNIFELTNSNDLFVRSLAVDIISFNLYELSHNNNTRLSNLFNICLNTIFNSEQHNNGQIHGHLLLLQRIYTFRPSIFHETIVTLLSPLTNLCLNSNGPVSVVSFRFINTVGSSQIYLFDEQSMENICQGYISKCQNRTQTDLYFDALNQSIVIFKDKLHIDQLVDFLIGFISTPSNKSFCSLAFRSLSIICREHPRISLDPQLFINAPICKNYIRCLKTQPSLLPDLKPSLSVQLKHGLSPTNTPNQIIVFLKMARTFKLDLFENYDEMHQCILKVYDSSLEQLILQLVKTVACEPTIESTNWLLETSIYDTFKSVRLYAINSLNPTNFLSLHSDFTLLLADPCFRIRRRALDMLSTLIQFNPFDFSFPLTEFVHDVLTTVRTTTYIQTAAKYASLLPILVSKFHDTILPIIPNIITICLDLLLQKELDDKEEDDNKKPNDTSNLSESQLLVNLSNQENQKLIYRDGSNDPDSYQLLDENSKKKKKFKIYKILNQKYFNKRDMYLLKTLAEFGNLLTPYLDRTLSAFFHIFQTRKSNVLLASALNSLTLLSTRIDTGLNLRLHHQHFIPVLMKLLVSTKGNEVSVAILKLFGTACDSVDVSEAETTAQHELGVNLGSPSFYADFTLSHLIPYFSTPTMQLFEAVTCIYYNAAKDAAKFVDLVIPMFFQGIDTFNDKNRETLFEYLDVITRQCLSESTSFLPQLTQLQLKYLSSYNCIKLAASLSFHLLSGYTIQASILFLPATRMLSNSNRIYFKYLMKFLSFAILFQDQPFEPFIAAIEERIQTDISPLYLKILSKTLMVLVQSKDLSIYQSRLSLLVRRMLQKDQKNQNLIPLLVSLCSYTNLPVHLAQRWVKTYNLKFPTTKDPISGEEVFDRSTVKKIIPKFKLYHPPMPFVTQRLDPVIDDKQFPDKSTLNQWLKDLCPKVIQYSPSVVIRSCASLASTMSEFRNQLFPIAFLSCWEKFKPKEKAHFSAIVRDVINNNTKIDPFFHQIIEILDRAFLPLEIPQRELAQVSNSRPLTLFFLQRLFQKNPKDHTIIEKLLDLNTTMGRHASAHGMLVHAKGLLEDAKAALWSEKLGEWDKALKLYEQLGDENFDISSFIRCYSHLEMWDKIKEMEGSFESWPHQLQEENAKHFAWAYYHCDDYDKVDYYISKFHKDQHLSEILFMVFYFLRTGRYEACQKMITKGFDTLAKDTSVYSGGDAIRLHKNLNYSQMFIELQESLNMLNGHQNIAEFAADIWNKRLKGFKRDSEAWIKLIAIRSLVFAPDEYINVYLKMISVLRKERRWNLIDTFFNRFFKQSIHPNVELEQAKISWARGNKDEAIDSLKSVLDLIEISESSADDEFIESLNKLNPKRFDILIDTLSKMPDFDKHAASNILQTNQIFAAIKSMTPEKHKQFLIKLCTQSPDAMYSCFESMFTSFGMDDVLEARIYRTLGYFLSSKSQYTKADLENISHLYEKGKVKNSCDYKIWLGWAYANSRLIDVAAPKEKDQYSLNAVAGFLKATQLRSSNTLEFLCQLFSIFFRIKNSKKIPKSLTDDLLELPANIIVEIIPQIAAQIAHSDPFIRNVVNDILKKFGGKHFQSLFYPLKLYEFCDEAKAEASKDLLQAIGSNHIEVAKDATLFVDGMLQAAISWFEQWIVSLDIASKASHLKDTAKMDKILSNLFEQYDNPRCALDYLFRRSYNSIIEQCRALFQEHTPTAINNMWTAFRQLFSNLSDKVKTLNLILLPKVSEQLANKRGFKIAVPGTYSVLHSVPTLESIEPALQVLGTQQHPRCVFMNDSSGKKVKFLLKGNEDIRLDQRVMQFFTLINSILNRKRSIRESGTQIVKYAIIPLAPNAGLITWVTGADTLHQMISDHRALHGISQGVEFDILDKSVGQYFNHLTSAQKYEIFRVVAKQYEANEVRDVLWSRAPNAATWLTQDINFTVTTALMCMVGYVIGLGDRHPSNIMVQQETGRVIHIDFGDSFESTIMRSAFPEVVPFRLTRMIVNALDLGTIEGIFRKTCEEVMWVLRESKASIVALLEIFIHEPLEDVDGKGELPYQSQIIDRVASKLSGIDELLFNYDEEHPEMDVEHHVDALLQEASDPSRYVKHYLGWCPFW